MEENIPKLRKSTRGTQRTKQTGLKRNSPWYIIVITLTMKNLMKILKASRKIKKKKQATNKRKHIRIRSNVPMESVKARKA